jgi:hypothetical protein
MEGFTTHALRAAWFALGFFLLVLVVAVVLAWSMSA